ncbi:MAG: citrate synthase, partial [Alphaproteobacteria bacterium]
DVLKSVVERVQNTRERMALAELVEKAAIAELAQRYPNRNLDTNVELFTAVLLEGIGLPRDLFTPVFAMGRVLGWTAHIFEQIDSARLIRPASRYVGPAPDGETLVAVAG